MRIFERVVSDHSGFNFNLLSNAMWTVLVTMTTVGYGDFYIKTLFGRLVGIIVAFWGVFIVSLFVVSLSTMLEFDNAEDKAYMINERLEAKENLKV